MDLVSIRGKCVADGHLGLSMWLTTIWRHVSLTYTCTDYQV